MNTNKTLHPVELVRPDSQLGNIRASGRTAPSLRIVSNDGAMPVRQKRIYASSVIVLIIGLCIAGAVYMAAGDALDAGPISAAMRPIAPTDSKVYVEELLSYGGTAAVLIDRFHRWLAGLWHGTSLAIVVAWIAIGLSLGLFLLARLSGTDRQDGTSNTRITFPH